MVQRRQRSPVITAVKVAGVTAIVLLSLLNPFVIASTVGVAALVGKRGRREHRSRSPKSS